MGTGRPKYRKNAVMKLLKEIKQSAESLVDSFLQETNLHVLLGITREEILWGLITVRHYSLSPDCPVKPIYVACALCSRFFGCATLLHRYAHALLLAQHGFLGSVENLSMFRLI